MAGIKDYSTTNANNADLNGISVAEGMLPSQLNNAIRALMVNTREWYNDSQWVIYGDGDGAYTLAYASATSFTVAGIDVTSIYHANRRIKAVGSTTGTIYGTISSSTFSTDTTVNVTWDSGSLSNESLTIYIGGLSATNTSIPEGIITSATLADGSVTTVKIADANVTNAKMASNAIAASNLQTDSVTTAKIVDSAVSTAKIADNAITTAKITDANVTTAKIADLNVTSGKIAADAIDGSKIADDSIDSEHYVDGSIDTAHIADNQITTAKIVDSNITTAKINDDAVTADKIADAVIVTNAEHSAHTPDDTTFFTTSASDARYFRQDSSETISSGDTWSASDSYIATTAAIDNRVVDLVDDVGGFVPVANETSFPTANPDVNNGTGTIVSVSTIGTTRTPTAGTVTIANGSGSNTVTITGCGSTVLTAGYGLLVETTTTLHTYTFHRLVPKATEVTTVASISSDITTVANNDTNITTLANNDANITTVAGISADVTSVANIDTDVTAVANDATDIGIVSTNIADVNTVASLNTEIALIGTTANVNSITTAANNLTDINSFANTYLGPSASAPTQDPDGSALDVGDLYFDTTSQSMKVYSSSGWIPAGSSVNGTSARFVYTATSGQTTFTGADDNANTLAYDAGFLDVYLNGVKLLNGTDFTATSGTSIVLTVAASTSDVLDIVAYGTFQLANFSINDATDVSTGGVTDGQVLTYNASAGTFQPGNASSAEVYGFNKDSNGNLIVTTTDGGNDDISSTTFANFDDVLFSASGFTFSLSNGELIATI
jgi:hypothetical protein